MLGLGEEDDEILQVMRDLRAHDVDMLTLGQYLQPSQHHLPVQRFVTPERFARFEQQAMEMGFRHAACGPMVRSSYHADQQAAGVYAAPSSIIWPPQALSAAVRPVSSGAGNGPGRRYGGGCCHRRRR